MKPEQFNLPLRAATKIPFPWLWPKNQGNSFDLLPIWRGEGQIAKSLLKMQFNLLYMAIQISKI